MSNAFEDKLASSGLTVADAKKLGMEYLTPSETKSLSPEFKDYESLKINYYNPDGSEMSDIPAGGLYFRLRYLNSNPVGWGSLTEKKAPRYVQARNTAPCAYYPKGFCDWPSICSDIGVPLIVTEGELKAAKATKEGFPTIAIGGVHSWRSRSRGITFLESLKKVDWLRRNVYICFDSDYLTNENVCLALKDLADELERRGSFCHIMTLPSLPSCEKVGIDDFFVHSGDKSGDKFRDLLHFAEPLGLSSPLWLLNDKYVYVKNPAIVVSMEDLSNKVKPAAFKEHLESTEIYQERSLRKDGSVSYKPVSASGAWLKWPQRNEVGRMTYAPSKDRIFDGFLNTWMGWGVEPKAGDPRPFLELVGHVFSGCEPEAQQWFLRWCAYPLQHAGVKMFTSVVVHGVQQGTGKSLLGYSLGAIYGVNFTEIRNEDLSASFNEWADSKQFIMGDDVTGSDKRGDADYLKKLITQKEMRINIKHIPSYVVPDCINYYFTSNQPDSFFLEDTDRRFFIHETLCHPKSGDFYRAYDKWLNHEDGASIIFDYLLNLDLGDFDPSAPAIATQAKARMLEAGRSDLGSWVRDLRDFPESVLRVGGIDLKDDLYSSKDLLNLYDSDNRTRTTANGLGRELARAGFKQALGGAPIRLNSGEQKRLYIVRNLDKWVGADRLQIVEHLDKTNEVKF